MKFSLVLTALASMVMSSSAFTIRFQNNCGYTVWPAIGKAPNGIPDTSVSYGTRLASTASASFSINDREVGIHAWGRTGCDSNGANCATGRCNGGLVCNDAGITSAVVLSEYGWGDYGQWGGQRISWNLSKVSSSVNINTRLSSSDGQSVACTTSSCPPDQAYNVDSDHQAVRNSPLGSTFTHTFC